MGTLMLFAGGTLVLMVLGVFVPDEPPGPGGRIIAFLFGGTLAYFGGIVVLMPLRALADAEGARGWFSLP